MKVEKNFFIFILLTIPISLIVGLRGATLDTQNYINIFYNINDYDLLNISQFYNETSYEIGYGWFSYIFKSLNLSHEIFFIAISILTFYFIYKVSIAFNISYLSVFFLYISSGYFLMQQFMQMRQGLAVPLVLYSMLLFTQKKRVFPILLAIIAISFHQSMFALVSVGCLSLLFFKDKDLSMKEIRIYSIFFLILFIFICKFILLNLMLEYSSRLQNYASDPTYADSLGLFRLPNIRSYIVFLLVFIFSTKKMFLDKLFLYFYIFLLISISIRIGFSDFGILSSRFSTVFSHVEIFLLPLIFKRFGVLNNMFLFFWISAQFIATYMFQAPYVMEHYFIPLDY
ncbi:hypothetical protein A4G19_08265 [Pasteurellaceae bacterium Macca]|nr:hypothetical protein [Pasteurellaceae bacterium Macca]